MLIALNTTLTTLRAAGSVGEGDTWADVLIFLGQTPVALLITLLVATYTLGTKGRSLATIEGILNDALAPICAIILITGAGGMFGGVLRQSGIGAALSDSLADLGLPLVVSAFVIATLLRVAQGSATVALGGDPLTTAATLYGSLGGVKPLHIVVMGVSGSGKSTIGRAIADRLGWDFAEGDDYHPQANVDKMASGHPLVDEDRWPWLHELAQWTADRDAQGRSTVLTCSALRTVYRDILRRGGDTFFVHLTGDKGLLLERMQGREHFMAPSMLESQLDTLEQLGADEKGMVQDVANLPGRIAAVVAAQLDLA